MKPVMGSFSDGVLVVDDDGLFISGPAVVIIIEDNRPICRHFRFSLMRILVLLPQPQMVENALTD
jgi:hypothetical protein